MERHKERTIMCKCSCHSVVWQRAGTYKDWPVLLAIWDPETGRRGSGNIKGHCMWHPNQCTSTCRDFVIYSFVTFGGTFRREEETWARNRKSLHTAQKWCNFLLEGTDFGEEKKKKKKSHEDHVWRGFLHLLRHWGFKVHRMDTEKYWKMPLHG